MLIKNLENKLKLVIIVCGLFVAGSVVVALSAIWTARGMVEDARGKIYVMAGSTPFTAERTDMRETLSIEAKAHVERFHSLFFTLAPDDNYIKKTMAKAFYLCDESAIAQYNTLKEKGFYNNVMSSSSLFTIMCDSVSFNEEDMTFKYYGKQRIERRSSVLERLLVTGGRLKRVPRTDNNPHGLMILDWRTTENKDLRVTNKQYY